MFNQFLFTKIEEKNIWFQQNGVTCYTAEATLDVLCPILEYRIMSRRVDVVWAPRCCDFVKDKYYADKPETIDALNDNIREAIGEI